MTFGKSAKLGIGGAALALMAVAGVGFMPTPMELPTVTVHHNPT